MVPNSPACGVCQAWMAVRLTDSLTMHRYREGSAGGARRRKPAGVSSAAAAGRAARRTAGPDPGRAGDQGPDARPAPGGRGHQLRAGLGVPPGGIVETAVGLVDATYGALGVIGEDR